MKPLWKKAARLRRFVRQVIAAGGGLLLAAAVFAQGNSPWENAVNVLQQAFISTIARGLSLVSMVVAGLTFAFGEGGTISLTLEDGRKLEFNAAARPHFDHGYALTSHSAQGLTADRALINADTGVHPDLLSSRFAYVIVSRVRLDAEL